ncbi:MAG TPA: hypothetical protein VN512_10505, partial [Clostridia bacterium]|nr:hypothetical protein [Clostridia bacterium]
NIFTQKQAASLLFGRKGDIINFEGGKFFFRSPHFLSGVFLPQTLFLSRNPSGRVPDRYKNYYEE